MVTIGVLFLLETLGYARFHYTWPVLLIVSGLVQVLCRTLSDEGHIQPFPQGGTAPVAVAPAPSPVAPPPSSSSAAPEGGSHV
jgi:hypothetical protein